MCVLMIDGDVQCVSSGDTPELDLPDSHPPYMDMAMGYGFICMRSRTSLQCFGSVEDVVITTDDRSVAQHDSFSLT